MIGSNVARLLGVPHLCDLKIGNDALKILFDYETIFDCASPTQGIGSNDFHDTAAIPIHLTRHAKHFVYCSSSCVYPDWADIPTKEADGFMGQPEEANRGYGWAKRVGELACKYSGIPCTVVRPSNIYGPSYDWSKPHKHVIPSLITRMLAGENPLVVWGSGHQSRSFMYEEDCAKLIVALSKYEGTFNLGGDEMKIGHLAKIIAELIGFKGDIVFDTSKPEGPLRKCQDTNALGRVLGSVISTPLEEGLRQTIAAARNHRTRVAAC